MAGKLKTPTPRLGPRPGPRLRLILRPRPSNCARLRISFVSVHAWCHPRHSFFGHCLSSKNCLSPSDGFRHIWKSRNKKAQIYRKGNRYNTYTQEGTRSRKALQGIDGFRVLCLEKPQPPPPHQHTLSVFFAIILFCFCSYLYHYPLSFRSALFLCCVSVLPLEMEHNFISRMSERVTLGYQIKNSSFASFSQT